jgi:hypothetical protein
MLPTRMNFDEGGDVPWIEDTGPGLQPDSGSAVTPGSQWEPSNIDGYGVQSAGSAGVIPSDPGVFAQLGKALGLGKDLSDGKNVSNWAKFLVGNSAVIGQLLNQGKSPGQVSAADLRASLPGQASNNWTPAQQAMADRYFNSPANNLPGRPRLSPSAMSSVIVPGRGYADGGDVEGPLSAVAGQQAPQNDGAPFAGYVQGQGGGQDDIVPANLAAGEYVFDADTVSALGDGNNERGAQILDQFREQIRAHKRQAPADEIPPKALPPDQYMPQGALGAVASQQEG